MSILGQKSYFLGPTIFKIPQPNGYYYLPIYFHCRLIAQVDHLENSDPSQVWCLDGSTLKNKAANLWKSEDEWKFGQKGEMYYIENVTKKKVLGATNFGKIIEEDFEEDNLKLGQLWKKVDPVGPEGDFLLENAESTKFMTAISNNTIEHKGNCLLYLYLIW